MSPGNNVNPGRSMSEASGRQEIDARGPAATIRSPSMTTAASGTGDAPVPSISVAPSRTCMACLAFSCDVAAALDGRGVASVRTVAQPRRPVQDAPNPLAVPLPSQDVAGSLGRSLIAKELS